MILTKNWCTIDQFAQPNNEQNMDINYVFANRSDEEELQKSNLRIKLYSNKKY